MDIWETHLSEGILLCADTPSRAWQTAGGEGYEGVLEQGQEKQADLESNFFLFLNIFTNSRSNAEILHLAHMYIFKVRSQNN